MNEKELKTAQSAIEVAKQRLVVKAAKLKLDDYKREYESQLARLRIDHEFEVLELESFEAQLAHDKEAEAAGFEQ